MRTLVKIGDVGRDKDGAEVMVISPGTATVIAGVFSLIAALATLLFFQLPNSKREAAAERARFRYELIRSSLRVEEPDGRANSLRLLIEAELLTDSGGVLREWAGRAEDLPHWPPVPGG